MERNNRKSDGETVIKNPIEPMFTDKIIDFEESLAIGDDSGDDYFVFRDKLDVAVDNGGSIFILDIGNQRILKFKKFLDFFNERGQFLGSYTLKEQELRLIDNEGNFYFSQENPFPRIIKARLTISEIE